MGAIESGEKVATSVVDSLKSQPMTLALVVMNVIVVVLIFFGSKDFRANQLQLMSKMIELAQDSQQMLSKCIVPPANRTGLPLPLPYKLEMIQGPK
jgi:hypothetical protein